MKELSVVCKRMLLYLICAALLLMGQMGCGIPYHYTNMDYINKSRSYYCKGNKIKINKIEDIRNITPYTWYASVRGMYNNSIIELHSVKSVEDNIGYMIKNALDLRGCKTDLAADFILFPTVNALSADVYNFSKEFIFRMSYVMKTTDGAVIYENDIYRRINKGEIWTGILANLEDLKGGISEVVSDGIDEMIDKPELWNAVKNYHSDKQQLISKNMSKNQPSISGELNKGDRNNDAPLINQTLVNNISNVDYLQYSQNLVKGKTTRRDVEKDLGKPTEQRYIGGYEYWAYYYIKLSPDSDSPALHRFTLKYDNNGILYDYANVVVK